MRVCLALVFFWALNAYPLTIIAPTLIYPGEEQEYGIEVARKQIRDEVYVSISINKDILCTPKRVIFFEHFDTIGSRETEVHIKAGSYTSKFSANAFYESIGFFIQCDSLAKAHENGRFISYVYKKKHTHLKQ